MAATGSEGLAKSFTSAARWIAMLGIADRDPTPTRDRHVEAVDREERRRVHAQRVPLTYAIFLSFGALATGLEFVAYPYRRAAMLIA